MAASVLVRNRLSGFSWISFQPSLSSKSLYLFTFFTQLLLIFRINFMFFSPNICRWVRGKNCQKKKIYAVVTRTQSILREFKNYWTSGETSETHLFFILRTRTQSTFKKRFSKLLFFFTYVPIFTYVAMLKYNDMLRKHSCTEVPWDVTCESCHLFEKNFKILESKNCWRAVKSKTQHQSHWWHFDTI